MTGQTPSPVVTSEDPIKRRRDLAERSTPRPWRWSGYLTPGRIDLPEIQTTHSGRLRVLAFVPEEEIRVVDRYEYDPVDITLPDETRRRIEDELREPRYYELNENGEIVDGDDESSYLVYVERGRVMSFRADHFCSPVGSEHVPVRWDCFRGQTAEEAGRDPYRYDVAGIAHPDAELLIQAANDYSGLLDVLEAAQGFLAAQEDVNAVARLRAAVEALTVGETP